MRALDCDRGHVPFGVLTLVALMLTLLLSCRADPHASRYATREPTRQDLVGEWRLRETDGGTQARVARLTLRADGTFEALNYPGDALGSYGTPGTSADGGGTWEVVRHQWFWVIRTTWRKLGGRQVDYGPMLHVLNDSPPHVLHHIIGDPDLGRVLAFEKVTGAGASTSGF